MKKLLLICISLFVLACSDERDNGGDNQHTLAGTTWELIDHEGFEVNGEVRDEWTEKSSDYDDTLLFRSDYTGMQTTVIKEGGQERKIVYDIEWEYKAADKSLVIRYIEVGLKMTFDVESISSSTLVLVDFAKDEADVYKYYEKRTYTKK